MAVTLGLGVSLWTAPQGGKAPSSPFSIYVFAKGELPDQQLPDGKLPYSEKKLVDSARDVRGAIEKNYAAWFRLVGTREEAEIVLEITNRGQSSESPYRDSAVQELAGQLKVLGSYDGPIRFTFKSGAGAGWRNVANRLVGVLHEYCEQRLASLEDERLRRQQTSALQVELETLRDLEAAAAETFRGLAERLKANEVEAAVAARTIEDEIVGPMARVRERMSQLKEASAISSQSALRQIVGYVTLREEAWTLTAEAIREGDDTKSQRAAEKHQEAKAALARLSGKQP